MINYSNRIKQYVETFNFQLNTEELIEYNKSMNILISEQFNNEDEAFDKICSEIIKNHSMLIDTTFEIISVVDKISNPKVDELIKKYSDLLGLHKIFHTDFFTKNEINLWNQKGKMIEQMLTDLKSL